SAPYSRSALARESIRWLRDVEPTTPAAPAKEASRHFLNGRSHPSLAKEGNPLCPGITCVPSSACKGGADGVVAHKRCFGIRLQTCRVSDHPVCGSSVASRLLIDAAATPPLQGGECASLLTDEVRRVI